MTRRTGGRHGTVADPADVIAGMPFLDGLPPGERALDALPGGLTNRNYRLDVGGDPYAVVRLSADKSSLLGIDRAAELANSRTAAASGVGPDVLDHAPNVLVVRWVDARTLDERDLDDERVLTHVARTCRALHGGGRFANDFDMFDTQRAYLDIVTTHGFRLPEGYREHEPAVHDIESALRPTAGPTVPCHNDLLAANILDDGTRLWFIDYEYAGNNDPYFELGNIWSEAALLPDRLDALVTAYLGAPSPAGVARARLLGLMSKYGWMLWASIQAAVSDVDFDFWSWGMEKYERAEADFADPQLDRWITTVREAGQPQGATPWSTPPS